MRDKLIILNTIQGDLTALRRLLETETDQNLDLIPQDCSDFNKPNVIELLRKAGAFVDDRFRETLLHVAIVTENINTVKLLIEIGCNVNSYNDRSESVLHFAVDNRLNEIVELLVEKGANINEQRPKESALCCAVKTKNVQLIKFLLDHGADVDNENDDCTSPFTYTADFSNLKKCKITNTTYLLMILMIVIRADLNRRDEYDLCRIVHSGSPLFSFFLHLRMIGQDFIDSTNLRKDAYDNIINSMEKKINNVISPIMVKTIALQKALIVGECHTIKFLIDSGVKVYSDRNNSTALHYAIKYSHYDVVKYLVDSGSDVHARGTCDVTTLHIAVQCKRDQVCKLLLARGANVNLMDIFNSTPLYYAVSVKSSTIVKLLLEYGAKVSSNYLSNDDDQIMSNLLIEHVAKLVCLNTWDDEKVLETIVGHSRMKFYYEKCIEELKKMKICKVYDICLFNILMDRGMTSRYARNEEIIEALDNAENQLNYDFPIYYLSSRKFFYEEVEKQRVVKGAATFLSGIFNFHDPFHLANRKILSYLSEKDINRINEI